MQAVCFSRFCGSTASAADKPCWCHAVIIWRSLDRRHPTPRRHHNAPDVQRGTTRGFGADEFRTIGKLIAEVVEGSSSKGADGDPAVETSVRERVSELCDKFPVYPGR